MNSNAIKSMQDAHLCSHFLPGNLQWEWLGGGYSKSTTDFCVEYHPP